jgi:hypothetical protein
LQEPFSYEPGPKIPGAPGQKRKKPRFIPDRIVYLEYPFFHQHRKP